MRTRTGCLSAQMRPKENTSKTEIAKQILHPFLRDQPSYCIPTRKLSDVLVALSSSLIELMGSLQTRLLNFIELNYSPERNYNRLVSVSTLHSALVLQRSPSNYGLFVNGAKSANLITSATSFAL